MGVSGVQKGEEVLTQWGQPYPAHKWGEGACLPSPTGSTARAGFSIGFY